MAIGLIKKKHFAVLLPVFNDWASLSTVLRQLDAIASDKELTVSVFCVDDGSTVKMPDEFRVMTHLPNLESLEIIELVCNVGSQRAIAIGLSEIVNRREFDAVIIMDSDGEDDPNDMPALLKAFDRNPNAAVLAQRAKRSEGPLFSAAYRIYKVLFRVLTGLSISFGNYCVLPHQLARRLTFKSTLWNSLPATVLLSRVPYVTVPTRRGKRLDGESHMNVIGLIVFGLHAITVFSDTVMVRLGLMITAGIVLIGLNVVVIRLATDVFVSGVASSIVASLTVIGLQVLFLLLNTSLLVMHHGSLMQMIPAIQYKNYVQDIIKATRSLPGASVA